MDDDRYGLSFLRSSLKIAGYEVVTAIDVESAREVLQRDRCSSFEAVLTDYRMPGESGLELMDWIRRKDETLSMVMITAESEKELIKNSYAGGAVGYLEKPVSHSQLCEVMATAVEKTRRNRRYAKTEAELAAVGRLDHFLNTQIDPVIRSHVSVFYRPLHEVGGDFLNVREIAGRVSLVVGDVSGHNVTAGYVSSYFQGMLRRALEDAVPLNQCLENFNRILCEEWGPEANRRRELLTTLAISALEIDQEKGVMTCAVAGAPPPLMVDHNGWIVAESKTNFPLGWNAEQGIIPVSVPSASIRFVLVFTDGVIDWANELEIDPLCLVYTLLRVQGSIANTLMQPLDDLLLVRFSPNPDIVVTDHFHPVIHETYGGDEADDIDQLEAVWRRSLLFALDEELGDRLFDLLICMREAVLNALVHGCDRMAGRSATLLVAYNQSTHTIRVRVDDPGKGHRFDLKRRLEEMPSSTGRQLGLGMIQHLSDQLELENRGASIVFDFKVVPDEPC